LFRVGVAFIASIASIFISIISPKNVKYCAQRCIINKIRWSTSSPAGYHCVSESLLLNASHFYLIDGCMSNLYGYMSETPSS
ncbi:MAG: hypothetical protein JSV14_15030, partial [Deltaproteobacteria bacterium]